MSEARHHAPAALITALLLGGPLCTSLWAQRTDGYLELIATDSEFQSTTAALNEREDLVLIQRYNLEAFSDLFPSLRLRAGGLFEREDTDSKSPLLSTELTRETMRPFLNLRYQTALISAFLGWDRLEDKFDVGGDSGRDIRDTLRFDFAWTPVELPQLAGRFNRTDASDGAGNRLDQVDTLRELYTEYSPWTPLRLSYRYGVRDIEDRLRGSEIETTDQIGRVVYSDSFWGGRLRLAADYSQDRQRREILRAGEGQILTPVVAVAGLSLLTDFLTSDPLENNPALVDGVVSASAGINLGQLAAGEDDRPRNIGLDLGVESEVNTLWLWIDRELPAVVWQAFEFSLYSSVDNDQWLLEEALVTDTMFGVVDNRFELRFPSIVTRYLKIVVRPLDPLLPTVEDFSIILVTELEAFLEESATDVERAPSQATERINSSLRFKPLVAHNLFYDVTYSGVDRTGLPVSRTTAHALSYGRPLGPRLSLSARAGRTDTEDVTQDLTIYPYTASISARWLPTLRQSLAFSGRRQESEFGTSDFDSIVLRTSADLYQGVTADLTFGASDRRQPDGRRIESTRASLSAVVIPHRTTNINLNYELRNADESGGVLIGSQSTDSQRTFLSVAYRPWPTLYLSGIYRLIQSSEQPDRTTSNYVVGWSPFPGGSLQLGVRFSEEYDSARESFTETIGANARWVLTASRYVEVAYFRTRFDSTAEDREQNSLRGSLRLTF